MKGTESRPGQFADAIKAHDPTGPRPKPGGAISHGHEGEEGAPAVLWPIHLTAEAVQQGGVPPELTGGSGAETAHDPS